jgi:rubrerythrin
MTRITSYEDVCVMAMEMEQVGRDFYTALAGGSDDRRVRTFCALAAGEEGQHIDIFRRMKANLAQPGRAEEVTPEKQEELRQLVAHRVQPDAEAVQKVAMGGTLSDALDMALRMEQDSIDFYQALAARLPNVAEVLRKVIREENSHLTSIRVLSGRE